jgi:TPP-dependent pyruvate/acetoin dehydrogenase alpha subunit
MQNEGPLTLAELDRIDLENKEVIDRGVEFAKASPVPEPFELYTDVHVPS